MSAYMRFPSVVSTTLHAKHDQEVERFHEGDNSAPQATRSLTQEWWKEGLAFLLATGALVAILVLLICFNNTLLRDWHSRLSINTLVATLAQVAASALLYVVSASLGQLKWVLFQRKKRDLIDLEVMDMASRGPSGSVKVAVGRGGLGVPAILGAWVTVLMLGLAPFAQQSVRVASYTWVDDSDRYKYRSPSVAELPTARQAGVGSSWTQQYGPDSVDPALQAAVYRAFAPSTVNASDVDSLCSTNNCTWNPYSSLAIYASTENVTDSIVRHCVSGRGEGDGATDCTWTVNNTSFQTSGPAGLYDTAISYQPQPMMTMSGSRYDLWVAVNQSLTYGQMSTLMDDAFNFHNASRVNATFAETYVLFRENDAEWTSEQAPEQISPIAYKVTMGFCIQQLRTTVVNGTTNTIILSQSTFPQWQSGRPDIDGVSSFGTGLWTTVDGLNFSVPYETLWYLGSGMVSLFSGNATVPSDTSAHQSSQMMAMLAADAFNVDLTLTDGEPLVEYRFNNIAQSLSNAMRVLDMTWEPSIKQITSIVEGTAWSPQPYIAVDFPWMIVPVLLWLLAFVEWLLTMWLTRRSGVPTWKSSLLGVLASQQTLSRSLIVSDLQDEAGTKAAKLIPHGRTWRLRHEDNEAREDGAEEVTRCRNGQVIRTPNDP